MTINDFIVSVQEEQGWSDVTVIRLLCDFIEEDAEDTSICKTFIQEKIDEEEELGARND